MKYFLYLFILTAFLGFGQNPYWDWAINPVQEFYGGYNTSITVDDFGNSFILAHSSGTKSDPALLNDSGAFIARFNRNGQFSWAKKVEGLPQSICADKLGNVYVGGYFYPNTSPTPTIGAFIKKYDYTGTLVWEYANNKVGSSISAIAVSPSGKVYVSGSKPDTMIIGPYTLIGKHPLMFACFNPNGGVFWARSGEIMPDTTWRYSSVGTIAFDANENIYTAYAYSSCLAPSCTHIGFLKLDKNGNHLMQKEFINGYGGGCAGIVIEPNGDIIASHVLSAWTSGGSCVLRRYKPDFSSFYWEKIVGSWQCQTMNLFSRPLLSGSDDIFIGGGVGTNCYPEVFKMSFGSDTIVTDSIIDVALCRIDRVTGNYTGIWHVPGSSGDWIRNIASDKFGNVYTVGLFNFRNSFNGTPPLDTLCFDGSCIGEGKPGGQLFVAKLKVSNEEFDDDVSIAEHVSSHNFLAPNPTAGELVLQHGSKPEFLNVSDITGRSCGSVSVSGNGSCNIEHLPAGVYIFSLKTEKGPLLQKIIKLK